MFEFAIDNILAGGDLEKNLAGLASVGAFNPFAASLYGATAFNGFLDLSGLPALTGGLENATSLPSIPFPNLQTTLSQTSLGEEDPSLTDIDALFDFSSTTTGPSSPESHSAPVSSPGSPATATASANTFRGFARPLPELNRRASQQSNSTTSGGEEPGKKKRRRPKPRMSDLPPEEAQAKRESNRESARKCRERKRERDLLSGAENEAVRRELADLRQQVQVLTAMVLERDATIAALTGQPLAKRLRLDSMTASMANVTV
eukprot:comp20986_c0_seq1/m.28116 comp20986_c0_seq1/g.28116  ORF comp20986_c0_seq1/g.28116 comp20986_c0_seq1/m.28116 type:complete len:261 (-) comp20986_c0_seq1:480-1262(-)